MFCTNCGNKLTEGAAFCTNCGQKIEKEEKIEEVTPVVEEVAPVEEAPVEEAPVEEAPVEEAPVEEAPVEEAPVETAVPVVNVVNDGSAETKVPPTRPVNNAHETYNEGYIKTAPALQLPTKRGLLKCIFLGLITLGIYNLVVLVKMSEEINITASRYDGQRTMHYFFVTLLAPLTLCIYPIVWQHKLCNRLGREVTRRGYNYNFSASTMWLWGVLGSLIIIGPMIYVHKLMKTSNLINKSYNYYG